MLHSALAAEAKKNAFIMDLEDEVCGAGCYRLDWILARASANTFVQTAVGFLTATKFRLSVLYIFLNIKLDFWH